MILVPRDEFCGKLVTEQSLFVDATSVRRINLTFALRVAWSCDPSCFMRNESQYGVVSLYISFFFSNERRNPPQKPGLYFSARPACSKSQNWPFLLADKMAGIVAQRFGMKDITATVTVPANAKAKLMYYLSCVKTVIQLDDSTLQRLTDYNNYYLLTDAETDALLAMVMLLSPDKLLGKVFFPDEDCGGRNNKFFELSAVSHMLAVTDNVLIGGERKRVAKVMFFQRSWLDNYYFTPLRSFQGRLQRMARGLPGRAPTPPPPRPPPSRRRDSDSCNIF